MPGRGVSMNKGQWKQEQTPVTDAESRAAADSGGEPGVVTQSLSYLILVTVRHGWVFLRTSMGG